MADPNVTNGTHEPETPKPAHASLALTEYSANPSPKAPTTPKEKIKSAGVPEDFLLPNGYPDYLRLILTAKVYDVIETTPLTPAVNLSNRLESNVLLKREDLLPVFSFKLRGAYNKMAHLSEAERWKGVIACSAGNHAQGVAFSARKLRIPATITMPTGTPAIKHMNVSRMGGNVVLHGGDFDAAKAECGRLSAMHGLTNIPPFDDPYVIAGQGTIGAEILRQADLSKLEAIFCCVGGGGLIAGTGVYVKRIAPHVKIIGVETFDANALVTSLKAGKRVTLNDVGLFADGAAVKTVGEETFRICSEVVDDVIQVDTDDICAAIKDVFEDTRSILEPAGALSLAGLKKYVERNPSEDTRRQLVAVASGANMNFDRLRFVAERAAIGEKKEAILAVTIPERPGAFARLVAAVNPMNVTEFCYRYSNPGSADVLIGLSVSASTRQHDIKDLIERL
ncbi:Threonine dehydratase, partial [Hortaea werneckii]